MAKKKATKQVPKKKAAEPVVHHTKKKAAEPVVHHTKKKAAEPVVRHPKKIDVPGEILSLDGETIPYEPNE